jgi:DNA mismatch endonuclease (patch repair protein)
VITNANLRHVERLDTGRQPFKRVEVGLAGKIALTTTKATSFRMGKVRQRGTTPELAVRSVLRALRLRYTLQNRDLPGSPDVANRRRRLAIFVHGCFWHRHPGCVRASTPTKNRRFWQEKFARNEARDCASSAELRKRGYLVLIVWECETEDAAALIHRLREIFRIPC